MRILLMLIAGALIWFLFAASNLPSQIPPRWTLRDTMTYRSYSLLSKFGVLSKSDEVIFKRFIEQGLRYSGDVSQWQSCEQHDCPSWTVERLRSRLDAWEQTASPQDGF